MGKYVACDITGRAYALVKKLKSGDIVQVDNSFTCLPINGYRIVHEDRETNKLYITCKCGKHMLDGQYENDDHKAKAYYVGTYKI